MNNRPYDSLRSKLVLPFVLLGFGVSALLSLITFALVANLEERAINRTLHVEMDSFRLRRQQNPVAVPPATAVLTGRFFPISDFPNLKPAKGGRDLIERVEQGGLGYSVLLTELDHRPYALFYERAYVNTSLGKLALYLLVGTGLMTLLSYFVANYLAGKVVRPIGKLLLEISEYTSHLDMQIDKPPSFLTQEYSADEIGELVKALDQLTLRLYGFFERESAFSGDVSHELRTPIAVIRGAAEMLVEFPNLPEAMSKRVRTIHRHAIRMSQIIEAMLLLSREDVEASDPACSIVEVINEVVLDAELALQGRQVKIESVISCRPIVSVERPLAYVLISNLVRNACAYTQHGKISVLLDEEGFAVVDTGIGIEAERFPDLFNRHTRGAESQGHGLGLSIVARIAERINWKIDIESYAGQGTRVRITFG